MVKPVAAQASRPGILQLKSWTALGAVLAPLSLICATQTSAHRTPPATNPISPEIVVANNCSRDITVYPLGSNGDVAPLGPVQAIAYPLGVAVDGHNNVYVLDGCFQAIKVFAAGSSGNAAPTAVITGDKTGLTGRFEPASAFAVDRSGKIYVAAFDSILMFAPGSSGNVSPSAVISGPDTGLHLSEPVAIALDPSGKIYVATLQGGSNDTASVAVYAPGSAGDAKPIATISGPDTGLPPFGDSKFGPLSIAADSQGQIYVLLSGFEDPREIFPDVPSTIAVYAPGSDGDAKPIHAITGPDTGLHTYSSGSSSELAVDSRGNIYVANFSVRNSRLQPLTTTSTVEVFPPGSDGDAVPSTVIAGPNTGLALPNALALDSAGNIYVADNGYRPAVHVYASGSNGDTAPVLTLGGPSISAFFRTPINAAADAKGNFYVLNPGLPTPAVDVYPAGGNGGGPPIATISGPHTGLLQPGALAADSKGDIYVTDVNLKVPPNGGGEVITYRRGSKGDAKPVAVISSAELFPSAPVAVGPNGLIYIANGRPSVAVYRPGSTGNVKPYAKLDGDATGLSSSSISSIAVDSCSKIYAAQSSYDANGQPQLGISVFAPRKFGNVAPIAVINGPHTALDSPGQIAVDSSGKIYVANFDNSVLVYAPGSNGDAAPVAVIAGPHTGLAFPRGIAIVEPPPDPHHRPPCR